MNWGTVPAANIATMVISCVICIGLPVILLVRFRKKGGWLPAFFIGSAVFVVFVLILEDLFHTYVSVMFGTSIRDHIVLYGLYGGLSAALFEETGRWIAFRFFLKNHRNVETALMYGAGHGGAESILVVGLTYINNITASIMINSGTIDYTISEVDTRVKQRIYDQLSQLWTSSAGTFLFAGVERIFAIALQLSFSVLVYLAVKYRRAVFWLAAFLIHFLADFATIVLANYISTVVVEIIVAGMALAVALLTLKLYKKAESVDGGNSGMITC